MTAFLFVPIKVLMLKYCFIFLNVPSGILMAQVVAGRNAENSKMIEHPANGSHPLAYIAQRLTIGQIAEKQGAELRPGVRILAKNVGMMLFATGLTMLRSIRLATWEKSCRVFMEGLFCATPA